jgi:hypothetical protein
MSNLLGALNLNPLLDLKDYLTTFYSDSNNNINTIDIFDSKYYDNDSFITTFSNSTGSIFLSLNTCSLMSKFSSSSNLLLNLTNKNLNIEVLALQETWAIPHPDLLTVPGFKLITKTRTNNKQ